MEHFFVVTLKPTAAYLSLSRGERRAWLDKIAAPIQEWSGGARGDGGVVFSERADDGAAVVLIVAANSRDVPQAFLTALEKPETGAYFSVSMVAIGPHLELSSSDDQEESKRLTTRIFEPFLDI